LAWNQPFLAIFFFTQTEVEQVQTCFCVLIKKNGFLQQLNIHDGSLMFSRLFQMYLRDVLGQKTQGLFSPPAAAHQEAADVAPLKATKLPESDMSLMFDAPLATTITMMYMQYFFKLELNQLNLGIGNAKAIPRSVVY